MLTDGIVSLGRAVLVIDASVVKSSPKIVWSSVTRPSTRSAPCAEITVSPSSRWNSTVWPSSDARQTPPSW